MIHKTYAVHGCPTASNLLMTSEQTPCVHSIGLRVAAMNMQEMGAEHDHA